jgi:hypothetical protein
MSGYWQIPVLKEDVNKMVFTTFHGTFEFTVMLFGLTNVPASFQHNMDIILSSIPVQESFPHHHQPHSTQVAYGGKRATWSAGTVGNEAAAV